MSQVEISSKIQEKSSTSARASPACDSMRDDMTPALLQPVFDYDSPAENGIMYVYIAMYDESAFGSSYAGKCILEVNLIYNDEDLPIWDALYDAHRMLYWGRVMDIETFYVVGDIDSNSIDRMSFVGLILYKDTTEEEEPIEPIYSGTNSTWNQEEHESAQVSHMYT